MREGEQLGPDLARDALAERPPGASSPKSLDWDEWTELLCKRFFNPINRGKPVTLFVDGDTLRELSGDSTPEQAIQSLTAAVGLRMGSEAKGLFEEPWRRCAHWAAHHPQSCPPSLPLLAVSVLAAMRMERQGDIAAHNYYIHFQGLLGLQRPVNEAYELVAMMWRQLIDWLNAQQTGARGFITAAEHPRLTNIGFALSQALFRASDLQRLTHFFQWLGLDPGDTVGNEELLSSFRAWALRAQRVSPGAQRMAGDDVFAPQLKTILARALQSWDGALRDEQGNPLGRISLVLRLYPHRSLALAAARPPGFPDDAVFRSSQGTEVRLVSAYGGDWYEEVPLPATSALLDEGLTLSSGSFRLRYKPDAAIPLRASEDLGGWVSQRRIVPGEPHWILVADRLRDRAEELLTALAEPGWRASGGIAPTGWTMLRDVTMLRRPQGQWPGLERLIPSPTERAAFRGGLPVLTGTAYLLGGEPDLWVPAGPPGTGPVAVKAGSKDFAVPEEGGVVALRDAGLAEGEHQVRAGPFRLTLRLERTLRPQATRRALAHPLVRDGAGYRAAASGLVFADELHPGAVGISGAALLGSEADLPDAGPRAVLVPAGSRECVLLGSCPGQVCSWRSRGSPAWLERAGLFPRGAELYPEWEAAWLCFYRGDRWITRLRKPLSPSAETAAAAQLPGVQAWRKHLLELPPPESQEASRLWREYQEAAGAHDV